MQNHFKYVLTAAQVETTNFHTFATRCVEAGFDIKSLSEILGHSNVNITMNRYVHVTDDSMKKAVAQFAKAQEAQKG